MSIKTVYKIKNTFFNPLRYLMITVLFCCYLLSSAFAIPSYEEQQISLNQVTAGRLLFQSEQNKLFNPVLLLNTEMTLEVNGMVATVTLKQHFKNTSEHWLDGVYVFPLPEDAAVNKMHIQIDERIIKGTVKEKKQAKKIYQKAKAAGKQASLVEQERPNLFTNSISNIGPYKEIVVEISYQQKIKYEKGEFELRFPMTMTPRYIPENASGKIAPDQLGEEVVNINKGDGWSNSSSRIVDAKRITPPMVSPVADDKAVINPVQISGSINMAMPLKVVSSLYHPINIVQTGNQYRIELKSTQVSMDRDFILRWTPLIGEEPQAALFTESKTSLEGEHENYLMIMLMPPQFLANQNRLPREMIFVIDTSGSMGGSSIRQAKSSLSYALSKLSNQDRFNIIEFNSTTHSLFSNSVIATYGNLEQAQDFVSSLRSRGGTEMAPALISALKNNLSDGYLRQVVFITDGSVGNEKELFSIIHQHLKEARLFTIGIGSAPNSYFMTKAAQFGRGTFTYIGSVNEVQKKMSDLFNKLESPILSHLKIEWSQPSDFYPKRIPDLYMGEPLVVSAKVPELKGEVTISGQTQQGSWQRIINIQQTSQHRGMGSIWARSKISDLMDKIVIQGSDNEVRQQIIDVAIKHQLMSKYTSFIAVDETPVRAAMELSQQQAVANVQPKGQVKNNYLYPPTATPAMRNISIGLFILLLLIGYQIVTSRLFKTA